MTTRVLEDAGDAWAEAAAARRTPAEHPNGKASDGQVATPTLPRIEVGTDEHRVNDEAVAALAKDRRIFSRGGALVRVDRDECRDGINRAARSPRIAAVALPSLREMLTMQAGFVNVNGKAVHVPDWCPKAVAARSSWPGIRQLEGIVQAPALRPDGTIICEPGYDEATGLFYAEEGHGYTIPSAPVLADAIEAAERLATVVSDFPFARPEHRAAWLASLLTPLGRFAFHGPSPLTLFDANTRGSGKSLIADVVGLIVTGRDMARFSNPRDDDECRKRITSLAIAGDTMALIDNVVSTLGCASLDAALTATVWKDRPLGRSELIELPIAVCWFATGNNVTLAADTSRRTLHVRLESPLENPEEREGFAHADLRGWVRENRPALLADALTILSAYCRAGRPQAALKPWGSFEGWSSLIRQAVVWVGWPDPGDTREELAATADRDAEALRDLLDGWAAMDAGGAGVTVADALARLEREADGHGQLRGALMELCNTPAGKLPGVRSASQALAKFRGRVVGGRVLDYRTGAQRTRRWKVVRVGQSDKRDESDKFLYPSRVRTHTHAHANGAETLSPSSPLSPPPRRIDSEARWAGIPE